MYVKSFEDLQFIRNLGTLKVEIDFYPGFLSSISIIDFFCKIYSEMHNLLGFQQRLNQSHTVGFCRRFRCDGQTRLPLLVAPVTPSMTSFT